MKGRLVLLSSLYFAQGLPFGYFTQTVPLLLRKHGWSLSEIGLTGLLAVPWALKFVWAPVVDARWSSRWGRRRSWILSMQVAAVLVLTVLGLVNATESMPMLMSAVLLLNLIAATQDIATDGLAVDLLEDSERGVANGLQVAAYRVGMVVGGGALLALSDRFGIRFTFFAMAGLTGLSSLPVAMRRDPEPRIEPGASGEHFLKRPGALRVIGVLMTYKAGEAFAVGMLRPFLVDQGLSISDIAWLVGTVGFTAGMIGALAGGALVRGLGGRRALLIFGAGQAVTVAGYAWLANGHATFAALATWCALEHLVSGMATAALFTCMMAWSRRSNSATDYTVQASAVVIATGLASAVSGFSAQAFGYSGHFALAGVCCLSALALIGLVFDAKEPQPCRA